MSDDRRKKRGPRTPNRKARTASAPATAAAPAPPWSPSPAELDTAWRAALDLWGVSINLSPPEPLAKAGASDFCGSEPLAYIDLVHRQVVVNFPLLGAIGAARSLTAVLAHEIGHHVRFPHTLGLAAQLTLLEQRLIPGIQQSLTNLFFDLQVNEVVGRTLKDEVAAVYVGFVKQDGEQVSRLFWFYLAVYEELWGLAPGTLAPAAMEPRIDKERPGCRAAARMFAQTFYALPDVYLQFVYFLSAFLPFLPDLAKDIKYRIPMGGDVPAPDLDDWAGGLYGNSEVERALAEARRRGWFGKRGGPNGNPVDPLTAIGDLCSAGRPGSDVREFKETLVSRHYKRLVDQHLLELPPLGERKPEPVLPTVTTDFDPGDDPRLIDWTASILAAGERAPIAALRRELEPEPPPTPGVDAISVEIYLDTSGSMPAPDRALNAMTLAAQILSASAIRHGGRVRGVIYSSDFLLSDWMYDEERARRFLLNYSGGGTTFPWPLLDRLGLERAGVVRVIISDADFIANLGETNATRTLARVVASSRRFVTLLALAPGMDERARAAMGAAANLPQLRLATVRNVSEFGKMATSLAQALFGR